LKVLLTGATGLIGSAVYAVLAQCHDVVRLGRNLAHCDYLLDLADPGNKPLPPCDALVHCAGVVDEDFRDASLERGSLILKGADYLAKAASMAGAKRAVYLSSSHVYGRQENRLDEGCVANPLSYYALAHYCTEQLFKREFSGAKQATLILRPNAVYGFLPDIRRFNRWTLAPFSFPLEAWARKTITLKSAGTQKRNFVSSLSIAQIIADWLEEPLTAQAAICHPIGGVTETIYAFAQRCVRVAAGITALDYDVKRPAEQAQPLGTFEYVSSMGHGRHEGEGQLDDHLKYLYTTFQDHSDWAMDKASELFD
jgi:UDP-glucose 4-epimerase